MPEYNLSVNGQIYELEVDSEKPILWVLRDDINLTGAKYGCGIGMCGACTIHLDEQPVKSCTIPISAVGKSKITTIEGYVGTRIHDEIASLWEETNVPQCGYCQTGQIMSTLALLARNKKPTEQDIDSFLQGNICRCGTYHRIKEAIKNYRVRKK